jgi:hypothetical protein
MPSSFKGLDLFGSGPHRFASLREGTLVVTGFALGGSSPGGVALGLVDVEVRVLGRVGYDLDSESADFHFTWNEGENMIIVHSPYRWLAFEAEAAAHRERFECISEEAQQRLHTGAVPYYRFPHTKDGTTLIEILEVLFEGLPQRIVLL